MEFLFYFYFGKFVSKNRAFGNNTIFYNNFLVSGGRIPPPLSPGYALGLKVFQKGWGEWLLCENSNIFGQQLFWLKALVAEI